MQLRLGGHLNYYDALERSTIAVDLAEKQKLSVVLETLGIPLGEVFLVSINAEAVALEDAWVQQGDHVEVYPPMGGG